MNPFGWALLITATTVLAGYIRLGELERHTHHPHDHRDRKDTP